MQKISLFSSYLTNIRTEHPETRAYISGVLDQFLKQSTNDYSKESITLIYARAKQEYNFNMFQSLGDWLFFTKVFYPEHLNRASQEYYNSIAQISYYRCYLIINRQWKLFEEMADRFNYLTEITAESLEILTQNQP